jgi:microcystin-dependent protein
MPIHTHFIVADNADVGNLNAPSPLRSLARSGAAQAYVAAPSSGFTPMAFQAVSITGSSLPHNNMMPYLTLTFCIALQGVFPPRQ